MTERQMCCMQAAKESHAPPSSPCTHCSCGAPLACCCCCPACCFQLPSCSRFSWLPPNARDEVDELSALQASTESGLSWRRSSFLPVPPPVLRPARPQSSLCAQPESTSARLEADGDDADVRARTDVDAIRCSVEGQRQQYAELGGSEAADTQREQVPSRPPCAMDTSRVLRADTRHRVLAARASPPPSREWETLSAREAGGQRATVALHRRRQTQESEGSSGRARLWGDVRWVLEVR